MQVCVVFPSEAAGQGASKLGLRSVTIGQAVPDRHGSGSPTRRSIGCASAGRILRAANIPSPVGAMHFSVPISAQKLCEHFQKCAISPVEDRPESS
jgi:hypothetical protein